METKDTLVKIFIFLLCIFSIIIPYFTIIGKLQLSHSNILSWVVSLFTVILLYWVLIHPRFNKFAHPITSNIYGNHGNHGYLSKIGDIIDVKSTSNNDEVIIILSVDDNINFFDKETFDTTISINTPGYVHNNIIGKTLIVNGNGDIELWCSDMMKN